MQNSPILWIILAIALSCVPCVRGEEEGEGLDREQMVNATLVILLVLIILSIAFEYAKEKITEAVKKEMRIVLQSMWGELTVLGFLSLVVFLFTKFGFFRVIKGGEAIEEQTESVHMAIFFCMIAYLAIILSIMGSANRIVKSWRIFEALIHDQGYKNLIIEEVDHHQVNPNRSGCCAAKRNRWFASLAEYMGFRYEFLSARVAMFGVHSKGALGEKTKKVKSHHKSSQILASPSSKSRTLNPSHGIVVEVPESTSLGSGAGAPVMQGKGAAGGSLNASTTSGGLRQSLLTGHSGHLDPKTLVKQREEQMESSKNFSAETVKLDEGFDFAEYLDHCIAHTLQEMVEVGIPTWVTMLVVVAIASSAARSPHFYVSFIVYIACGAVLPFLGLIVHVKLRRIRADLGNEAALVYARNHANKTLSANSEIPWDRYGPEYLDKPLQRRGRCGQLLCLGKQFNKHQQLFWFDRKGPAFLLYMIRLLILMSSILLAVTAVTIVAQAQTEKGSATTGELIGIGIAALSLALISLTMVPYLLKGLVFVTSVEQMRKKKIIGKVLRLMRTRRSIVALRLILKLKHTHERKQTEAKQKAAEEKPEQPPRFRRRMSHSSKMSKSEMAEAKRRKELREVFQLFDKDGEGSIDIEELHGLLCALGRDVNQERLLSMMGELDVDNSGTVSFDEFYAWAKVNEEGVMEEDVSAAAKHIFEIIDKDGSERIAVSELQETLLSLGEDISVDDAHEIVREFDEDGDGIITLEEFEKMLKRHAS